MVSDEESREVKETTLEEILKLVDMPFNYPERIPLEKSSKYIGLKILWASKIFLLGQKFPKN